MKKLEYTLLDKISITRPILFLCGPYYEKSNKSDRRCILQKMLYDTYKNKYLPLVIDDFLTEENIDDPSVSIQVMEEICAAISYKTYIFLDTMSAATELGIFANSAYLNRIDVFIPRPSDIYNRKNVGYFVHDVVLKKHPDRVTCLEYRPGLVRKALATDYVVEHYKFVNDELPFNIAESIRNDPLFQEKDTHTIHLSKGAMPETPYRICCQRQGRQLTVSISLRLLFYITLSVISNEYKAVLKDGDSDFTRFDIDKIMEWVNESIKNFISGQMGEDLTDCVIHSLNTALKQSERTLIYHITKFVHVYYLHSQFKRFHLLERPLGDIVDKREIGLHPYTLCGLSDEDALTVEDIVGNKDKYYQRILVRKNRRTREIVKYREDENGQRARGLHDRILKKLEQHYTPSPCSYAYRRGKSIKQCAEQHLKSREFLKYDIKKFFNSIRLEKLAKYFGKHFGIDERFLEQLYWLLDTCFYQDRLPLGLILSPLLSDIYMHEFDKRMTKKLESKGYAYTRYADDVMISAVKELGEKNRQEVDRLMASELRRLSLKLNREKMQKVRFEQPGNYIRYVGLNIVCGENGNIITVGRTYIYDLAKQYLDFLWKQELQEAVGRNREEREELEKELFYERMVLIGRLGFLRQIEGEQGVARVDMRLRAQNVSIQKLREG